ncbi:fumarylacetoacetate hydrolase family protein [Salinicoccus albus]|uniref:fumarylacetoacetate hydrolase family protein n=1 Tax=Salinicoccus albus TaxID=418756 RepID=UPI00037843D8|nr:fumarylacetoacetate hydrolase family protein [Salinicoccus albus]
MKLCNLLNNNTEQLGVYDDGYVINIAEALQEYPDENIPLTLDKYMNSNGSLLKVLSNYVKELAKQADKPYVYKEQSVRFGPSVSRPEKIICIGLNYQKHADETGASFPEVPILFSKFNNTLTGHKHDIKIPEVTDKLDYEVELALIIGETAKNVSEDEALNYVFGYTPSNDLSARDLQMRTPQWLLGKTCDDFTPIGPYLTTAEEIKNPQNLRIQTLVNNEIRQDSNTSDMIFTCAQIISYVSQHMTLTPGDVILTGTPEGVVLGEPKEKQNYLQDGDFVTINIESLGTLNNKFISKSRSRKE